MPQSSHRSKSRILIVDALRGFAMIGILLLHAVEHFDLLLYPEPSSAFLASMDPIVSDVLFFIFAGKAYSIFAVLFGLSFYIQLHNKAKRGIDFQWTFGWRLIILLVMGYFLSLLYIGEVLTAFAILGMLLIFFNRLTNKTLTIIASLLLLQIPTLCFFLYACLEPDFTFHQDWSAWANVFSTFSKGTFGDVIRFNAFTGHLAKWQFFYNSGRYLQLMGLFIIGLLIGRKRYFKKLRLYHPLTKKIALGSLLIFLSLYLFPFLLAPYLNSTQKEWLAVLMDAYRSFFFTAFLCTGFIVVCVFFGFKRKASLLSSYGKMSLTNYIVQPLFGVPFFYGFGLGMYDHFGVTFSLLVGLALLSVQLFFSHFWLKHYEYGPFEWLWRAMTMLDFNKKFKKKIVMSSKF